MGQDLPVRRPAACRQRDQQRALEPAAVLIASLEIHVRRPAELRRAGKDRFMARSRIEPDVEDVPLAFERRAAAGGARKSLRQEFLDGAFVPGVSVVLLEHRRGLRDERRRQDRFTARRTIDRRDRHTPGALA